MKIRHVLPLLSGALIAACAANPGPGEPGYAYNLSGAYSGQFIAEGQAFNATMELSTAPGGAVSGTFSISSLQMEGEISGMVVGSELSFSARYGSNAMTGCSGAAVGTVTIGEGGDAIEGPIRIDDCDTMSGRMRFGR